jgi:TolB-like protein/tetratricopeptide (TPR) repeat protein
MEADGTVFRGETQIHLSPKELAALEFLLARAGQIVTSQQLKQALWGDVHVTEDSVFKCLSSLRARLEPEKCIQTVYKRGYRLSVEVRPHGAAPAWALPRLAIAPFATDFGVPEHLGTAIAEETIVRLTRARFPAVSILARDSVFTLAMRGLTAQQIGETLKADLVLTGTLRTLASHFRLRAEMIRVEDETQIWVEDLLVDRNRIAGLEAALVNRLAFRLNTGIPIGQGSRKSPWGGGDSSLFPGWNAAGLSISAAAQPFVERRKHPGRRKAYENYQRGHHEWQTLQRHRMQDGLQHLSRAIELDPSLIAAKVDLAHLCVTQAFYGFMSPAVAADMVRRTAEPVLQATGRSRLSEGVIPDLPPGAEAILPALGWVSFHMDHNLPAAIQAFSRSADLPYDHWITRLRVMFALSRHRFDEAIEILRAALLQDPFSPSLHARLAWALHLDSQAAASVECIRHALALFPEDEAVNIFGVVILAFNGDAPRAVKLAQDLVRRSPYLDIAPAVHAYALACAGRPNDARALLERLQWLSHERFVLKSFNPAVYVALGDHDAALSELSAAAELRCPWFFQMLADPRLKPLHGRLEFDQLRSILTRMEADAAAAGNLETDQQI